MAEFAHARCETRSRRRDHVSERAGGPSPGARTDGAEVTVVIPCRNEAGAFAGRARRPSGRVPGAGGGQRIRGRDGVRGPGAGAMVVAEPVPGYGAAVQRGVESVTTPIVCVLDGDGSLDPGELPGLVALLGSGADLAVGRRVPAPGAGWPCTPGPGTPWWPPDCDGASGSPSTTSAPSAPHASPRCSTSGSRTAGRAIPSSSWSERRAPGCGSRSCRSPTGHGRPAGPRCRARSWAAPSPPGLLKVIR